MTPTPHPTFWLPRPGEPERIEHRTCRERTPEEEGAVLDAEWRRYGFVEAQAAGQRDEELDRQYLESLR